MSYVYYEIVLFFLVAGVLNSTCFLSEIQFILMTLKKKKRKVK